ncbi:hypothetical protein M0804_006487 [Polistes exclamans]|nr:hypothetical protein M0804_006487 [Polistes exclamans]
MFPPVLTTEEVGAGPHAQGQRMTHPGHTGHALKFGTEGGHSARAHPFMTKGKTGLVGWLVTRGSSYWSKKSKLLGHVRRVVLILVSSVARPPPTTLGNPSGGSFGMLAMVEVETKEDEEEEEEVVVVIVVVVVMVVVVWRRTRLCTGRKRERVEGTSAVHRRSLVQDFYPAELRRNLWMPFPYPQDTNSTLPTRLLSLYRSYITRTNNGCPKSNVSDQPNVLSFTFSLP